MFKKSGTAIIAALCGLFTAFTLGFFAGRNLTAVPIQVSTLTAETRTTVPSLPEETQPLTGLVNINTADQAELMELPGIGQVLSQRIIDYRNAYGSFSSVTDLLNVEGIGEKKLEQLLPYATTGG